MCYVGAEEIRTNVTKYVGLFTMYKGKLYLINNYDIVFGGMVMEITLRRVMSVFGKRLPSWLLYKTVRDYEFDGLKIINPKSMCFIGEKRI